MNNQNENQEEYDNIQEEQDNAPPVDPNAEFQARMLAMEKMMEKVVQTVSQVATKTASQPTNTQQKVNNNTQQKVNNNNQQQRVNTNQQRVNNNQQRNTQSYTAPDLSNTTPSVDIHEQIDKLYKLAQDSGEAIADRIGESVLDPQLVNKLQIDNISSSVRPFKTLINGIIDLINNITPEELEEITKERDQYTARINHTTKFYA